MSLNHAPWGHRWDPELLARTRRNLHHMASVEGLESTAAFREWR